MNISELGANITKFREAKNWSINKLKQESGIGYATLHDIENGKSQSITSDNLEKVAKALNVNTDELLGFEVVEITVKDLPDTLENILESDELEIDKKLITEQEKNELREFFNFAINMIRRRRKIYENNSNL